MIILSRLQTSGSLFCMLLLSLALSSFAGTTGKISGFVRDKENNEPLPGVNVVIEGTRMGAATDNSGYFLFLMFHPGLTNCARP